jgi:recombinational DNA repair protein (RecF pathway)
MGAQPLVTTAVVLDRNATGEHWLRLSLFSEEHGVLDALQRQSRRTASSQPPLDLFDEARFSLETRNQGRTWFVREATPVRRRPGLGRSYAALREACRFGQVLAQNPLHEDSRAEVYALLQRALDAWETGARPDAVYFKSLFLLARDEGYPVREEWREQLDVEDGGAVDRILRETAAEQTTDARNVARLARALEEYLRQTTAMRFDPRSG